MDNLCHSLAGAALGYAGLQERTSRGVATLVIASNLPDIDVGVFATNTLAMSFRRGWTHGVLAWVVLPVALASAMLLWDRWQRGRRETPSEPATFAGLLLLSCIGTWLHVFMDFLNSYGVRLLMPFSERWFYGDALFIIDPWLYLTLGAGVLLSARRWRRGVAVAAAPARWGLAVAAIYVAMMVGGNLWGRQAVAQGLARAGAPPDTRFMVTPVLVNPFRREVIIDTGSRYEKGLVWFTPSPHFRPAGYGVDTNLDHPIARRAAQLPRVQAFLGWSRFPFFVIDDTQGATHVVVNDYRYSGGTDGWSAMPTTVQ